MKKLIIFSLILLLIFLFKDQLNPYWIMFSANIAEDEAMGWLSERSEDLYRDLPEMDFDTAIFSLKEFETEITSSLLNIEEMTGEEKQRRTYHRNLICELAIVYKKLAMYSMRKGEDELYISYTRKSRDQVAQCADLKP